MSILGYRAKRTSILAVCLLTLLVISGTIFIRGIAPPSPTGTWAAAGNGLGLSSPRAGAAAVQLQDGRILITGGDNGSGAVASVDIYDTLGNFSAAAPMNYVHSQHTATVLQDGTVLVAGGLGSGGVASNSAEIYNPSTNTWTVTSGSLTYARSGHTATALHDGTVLIAGGDNGGTPLSSLEIYSPSTGAFTTVTGSLSSPREQHAAAALPTGDVIIMGGFNGTAALATSDLYTFSTGAVAPGPVMSTPRQGLSATTQLDGNVLVAGGNSGSANGSQDLATAEVYNESAGTFTLTGSLATARQGHQAFLLPHNGSILIVGGTTPVSGVETATSSVEMYYPLASGTAANPLWNGTFNPTGAMASPRVSATGSPLSNGTPTSINDGILLVAGGKDASGNTLSSGELYGFAWVNTDRLEYAPGTPVNVTGGGWQPGETVTLHFQEVPYFDTHSDVTAVADSNGNISNSQFSPDSHDIGINFVLTATGSASGSLAQTLFADAPDFEISGCVSTSANCTAGELSGVTINFYTNSTLTTAWSPASATTGTGGTYGPTANGSKGTTQVYAVVVPPAGYDASSGSVTGTCSNGSTVISSSEIEVQNPSGGGSCAGVNFQLVQYGSASKLAFTNPPTNTAAGSAIDSPTGVQVSVEDSNGNVVANNTTSVTIAIGTNPGGGTLSGTTTVNAVKGVATFSNLSINKAGTGYTLAASSSGLTGQTSSAFNITAGTVNAGTSTVVASPPSVAADGSTTSTITVTLLDAGGNPVSGKTVTLTAGSGSSTISAASGASNASGVVTFTVKDTVAQAVTYTAKDTTDGTTITQTATVTFTAVGTTTTVSSSASPSTFGQAVAFTATVAPASGTTAPTGSVQFVVDGTNLGSAVALTTGGSCPANDACATSATTTTLTAGTHTVTANYTATGSFSNSPGTLAGGQVVSKANPTLSVTNTPVTYNGSAQAAAVSGSVPGTVSNIQYNGSSTTPTAAGTYAITANFAPTDSTDYSSLTAASAGNFVISQATPTITFGTAATPTYLGGNFTVSATTTNTDSTTLTYSYLSGPCAQVSGGIFRSTGAGTCTVQASGAATTNFVAASNTQIITIAKATPTVTFGTAPTPTYLGGNFTVSATTTNTDSSTLTYSQMSGPCASAGGAAFSSSGAGTCVVQATGAATTNFLAASNTQSVTIGKATPVFSPALTSPAALAYGTASVSLPVNSPMVEAGGVRAGSPDTVTITINGVSSNPIPFNGTSGTFGPINFPTSTIPPGTYTITYAYSGNTNFASLTDASTALTVNKANTSTSLISSANPSAFGQLVTFTATVADSSGGSTGNPTGTVTFKDGATTLGMGTLSGSSPDTATFTTSTLSVATHSVTAAYGGDSNFTSSSTSTALSQVVNPAATTTTIPNASSLMATSTVVGQGEIVDFSVTVNPPGVGPVSGADTVTVSDGTSSCTAAVSVGNCVLTYTSAGAKTVTATYSGDTNFATSTSAGVSHTVNQAATTTTITNASSLATASIVGQAYAVNYSVAVNSPGSGTIPGAEIVTVSDGTSTCTGTLAAGACNLTSTTSGSKTITAAYSGDTNFATSTSTGVPHTVNNPVTTTSLGSSPNPSTFGQSVTFTATVMSGSGTPTGSVTFVAGSSCPAAALTGSTSNPSTLSGGVATFSTSALPGGIQTITACYSPSGIFNSSNGSVSQMVNPAAQMITFTAPASPVTFGVAPITLSASSTSGLPVTFTIDSTSTATGSVSGDVLTITSAGTLVIDANQSGNNNYQAAAQVQNTIVINPANYVVTVSSDDAGTASNCTPQSTARHGTDASCSLRDALLEAAAGGGGNITFDSTVFGSPTTITLTNGTLTVPTATTVTGATSGSGASLPNLVSVDGNNASTVFTVGSGVTASISNLIIQHGASGTPPNTAGGIINDGTLTLIADSIINNAGQFSGGIVNVGTLLMTASTVSGNSQNSTIGGTGGGIYNIGNATLVDDTISGNTASTGAGISNGNISSTQGGNLSIADSTISGNVGGDILESLGAIHITNTIVAGSVKAYTDGGGNVIGLGNGTSLAPLANYGGPTQTMVPLPGSPAICAGLQSNIPSGLTTDQRNLPNTASYPGASTCVDAGAVQTNYAISFSGAPPAQSLVNTNFAAAVTLTESGTPFVPAVTIPLTLATGSGTLTGGSASTSSGIANYTLQVSSVGTGDQLTANLTLNGGLNPAVAISALSNNFDIGKATPTVGLSLSSSSITYGTSEMFTATLPSSATGTVTFYNNGSTVLGTAPVSNGTASFTTSTPLGAGSYSITASYSGDSNYNVATSSPSSLTVTAVALTITAKNITKTYGQTVTFAGTEFTPSGLVNGDTVTSVTLTSAGAAATATVAGSTYPIVPSAAMGSGLSNYIISYVNGTLTVNPAMVTPSITASNKPFDGTTTATVTCTLSGVVNSDSVSCSATSASFSQANAGNGLTVTATGIMLIGSAAPNYSLTSTTAQTTASITPAPTATTAISNPNPSVYGQTVTFTAFVNNTGSQAVPTGTVSFTIDGTPVGGAVEKCPSAIPANRLCATYSTSALTVSSSPHSVSANYTNGDGNFQSGSGGLAGGQTVNPAPLVITASSGGPIVYGASPFVVAPMYSGFVNGEMPTSLTTAPTCAPVFTTTTAPATYVTSCSGAVDSNYSISYVAGSVTVTQATTTTTLTVTSPINYGDSTTVTATVAPQFTGAPTGTVSVSDGIGNAAGDSCTITLSKGTTCTLTPSAVAPSGATVTGIYSGDADFQGSQGTTSLTVNPATTSTTLNPTTPSILGQAVSFTAAVMDTSTGDSAVPNGNVFFYDGTNLIGSAPLNGSGNATLTTALLSSSQSPHSITASFVGNVDFSVSTSSAVSQTVNPRSTSTTASVSPSTVVVGQSSSITVTVSDAATTGPSGTPGIFALTTNSINTGRTGQAAALLPNGTVLVAGGQDLNGHVLPSAEIYDPTAGTFTTTTNSLSTGVTGATATLLPNGTVLIAGGSTDGTATGATSVAEIFDPIALTFTQLSAGLNTPRLNATATLLPSGKVLIAGGENGSGTLNTMETYDLGTQTFTAIGNTLAVPREGATATLLYSGKILFTGGSGLSSAEIYDPTGQTSTLLPNSMTVDRTNHAAVLQPDGNVLIVGGTSSSNPVASAELYNMAAQTFTAAANSMNTARSGLTATMLDSAQVVVIGGSNTGNPALASAELDTPSFDPLGTVATSSSDNKDGINGSPCALTLTGTGTSTCQITDAPAEVGTNPHTITATYVPATDLVHLPSDNTGQSNGKNQLTVKPADTTTSVVSTLNSSTYGQSATFTATVAVVSPGAGAPTGTVQFEDNGTPLGSPVALSGASASLTTSALTAGSHTITAIYSGDPNFNSTGAHAGSTATPLYQTVNKATPIFSNLTAPLTIVYGTGTITVSGSLTASTATPPNADTVTISIKGTAVSQTVALSGGAFTATLNTATVPASATPYTICYSFAGDSNFNAATNNTSTTLTVQKATPVFGSLTAPLTIVYGTASITVSGSLTASTATPPNTDSVMVSINGTAVSQTATLSGGAFTATLNTAIVPASATPYAISYSFAGDSNFNAASNNTSTMLTVQKATPAFSNLSASQVIAYGAASVTVSGKLAATTATPPNTDSVTVSIGTAVSKMVSLSGGSFTATFTLNSGTIPASATPYAISYSFAGDANFNTANDSSTSLTVSQVPLAITASSGSMTYGGTPFVVMPMFSGFVYGEGPANLTAQPTCLPIFTSSITAGTYTSTCSGAADSNYAITYMTGNVMVTQASTSVAVSSSLNPSTYMQLVTFTATVSPQYAGTPTGNVTFYDTYNGNTTMLGTGTLSVVNGQDVATFNTSSLQDQYPNSITAMYGGDGNFTGNTSSPITQTVSPAPVVSLDPLSVSFGNQNVNTTSRGATITLSNVGDATLNLSTTNGISITGSNSSEFGETNTCGSTVAAGSKCTITVTFTPVDTGVATATLQVTDNDDDTSSAQQIVSLTGAGLSTINGNFLYPDAIFATANGCGSIVLSGGSTVDSFDSVSGYNSSHELLGGNVGTNGNVTLNGGKSTVYGSASALSTQAGTCSKTSVTGLTSSGGAQVTGGLNLLSGPVTYPTPPVPSPAPPTTNENVSGSCPSGMTGCSNLGSKDVSFAPGQYGNVSLSGGTTAHFQTGTYNINSLTLSGNSILYVDSGPVIINLAGNALSGGSPAMDVSGGSIQNPSGIPANLQFLYAGSRGLNLSGGSGSYATVYAPNALVNMSGGSDFFGSIVGSTVTNSGGTAVHYDANLANIQAGDTLWISAVVNNLTNLGSAQVKLYLTNSSFSFTATSSSQCTRLGGTFTASSPSSTSGTCAIPVPNAVVTLNSASATSPKTSYDLTNNRWNTSVPTSGLTGNTFATGIAIPVPTGGFPTGLQNVSFSTSFSTDSPGLTLNWQWGAAVYSSFSTSYATTTNNNVIGVNAEDGSADTNGADPAGTAENYKANVVFGGTGGGLTNYTGFLSVAAEVLPTAAPMSVSPSSLNFGTQAQGIPTATPLTAVLTNNDVGAHNISGISLMGTDAGNYTLQSGGLNNCMGMPSLAAGGSCTLYVSFTPTDIGTRTAKIAIGDDANNSPQTVYLTGTGR